jgi:hypothetical protein
MYMFKQTITKLILLYIKHADADSLQQFVYAIVDRSRKQQSPSDLLFLSLPRFDLAGRRQQLELFITFLRNHDPAMQCNDPNI